MANGNRNRNLLTPAMVKQANNRRKQNLLTPNMVQQANAAAAARRNQAQNRQYTAPAAVGMQAVTGPDGGFEIDHVCSINGTNSASPTITTYQVNPGLSDIFPVLYQKANMYEQYRIREVQFAYLPTCATSTPGSVILSPEYDVNDTPPTTLVEIRNTSGTLENSPWVASTLKLDPTRVHTTGRRKLVRDGVVATTRQDYDMCNLSLATVNNGTTNEIGLLKVKYKIDFFIRQRSIDTVVSSRTSSFNLSADQTLATTVPETIVFDEALGSNALGITNTAGVFTLPKGAYKISVNAVYWDSANEEFTIAHRAYKNSSATTPPQLMQSRVNGTASGPIAPIAQVVYITSNGTDTFEVTSTLTGAAGTLKVMGDNTRVLFEVI